MSEESLQKVGIKQAVKIGLAIKEMNLEELARLTGRELSTLSGMLTRGTPNLSNTIGLMDGLGAKVVVKYANGQEVELVMGR